MEVSEITLGQEKIKAGIVYMQAMSDTDLILRNAKKLGLNALKIPVRIDIESATSTNMHVDSVTLTAAQQLIRRVHTLGMKVILEPFPQVAEGNVSETDYNPSDIDGFFWNWREGVLKTLVEEVVNPLEVFAINIASNLIHLEGYPGYWSDVIKAIRKWSDTLITYRTQWWITATWDTGEGSTTAAYQKKLYNSTFIRELDFLSISAYFELTDKEDPTLLDLTNSLRSVQKFSRGQNIFQEIYNFHNQYDVPIFFGELGFPSKKGAASEPWNHLFTHEEDPYIQANLFSAYQALFEDVDWMIGFAIWQISYPNSTFYPMDKLAERVIYNFYGDLYPLSDSSNMLGDTLYNLFPNIHRKEDGMQEPRPYPLKRFFQVASVGLDYMRERIEARRDLYDVDKTPAMFLPYLYRTLGFPFPTFLPEDEQRQFLKILPQLYVLKGTNPVFEFLGRTFFGDDSMMEASRNKESKITIDLHVQANGSLDNLNQRTERFLYFADFFRPVNRKLNVVLTLFYDDQRLAGAQDNAYDYTVVTSPRELEDFTKKLVESNDSLLVTSTDTETYNRSNQSDGHTDYITMVVETEVFSNHLRGRNDNDSEDIVEAPKNKFGRGQLGKWKLGD